MGKKKNNDPTIRAMQKAARILGLKLELELVPQGSICGVCGVKIETMIYKGTGVCSDAHRKVRDGNDPPIGIF